MTMNIIISSVLHSVQTGIAKKRSNISSLDEANIVWTDEAKAMLSGIPASKEIDLSTYLSMSKGYDNDALQGAGAAIAIMEAGGGLIDALANGGDLTPFTNGEKPDAEIVNHILSKLNIEKEPTVTAQPQAQADTIQPAVTVDPGMVHAINALLNQATKGKITDLGAVLMDNAVLTKQLGEAKQDLTNALMKARQAPIATTGTVKINAEELTYTIVNRKANEVFPVTNGKPSGKGLGFEIPTLVWKDKAGNVVQHPKVPDEDPNYDFDAVRTLMFLTGTNRNMNQWLFGHTGTGKSTFVEQIAARTGWPVTRVNLDSNLERADLVGQVHLVNDNGVTTSKFEDGILPNAMPQPGYVLFDEMDAGRPDILFVVQRALEGKGLMLTEDNGRIVQPHPLFRFVATANTRGQGDEYGMYAGVRTMNAAMIDRFTGFIEFQYMKPDRESALLQKLVPALAKDVADKMANFALEVRTAFSKGEVYNTISPRGLTVLADCYATFTGLGTPDANAFQLAMDMSVLNKVTNDTRQKFIELASRCFGFKVK